jgi:hypothetical protein
MLLEEKDRPSRREMMVQAWALDCRPVYAGERHGRRGNRTRGIIVMGWRGRIRISCLLKMGFLSETTMSGEGQERHGENR